MHHQGVLKTSSLVARVMHTCPDGGSGVWGGGVSIRPTFRASPRVWRRSGLPKTEQDAEVVRQYFHLGFSCPSAWHQHAGRSTTSDHVGWDPSRMIKTGEGEMRLIYEISITLCDTRATVQIEGLPFRQDNVDDGRCRDGQNTFRVDAACRLDVV